MTHAQYLEDHHAATEAAYTHINACLGADEFAEAKAALVTLRSDLDALWAQRVASAEQGVQ